jgi:hypothetical protein
VGARFEVHVQRAAASSIACLLERQHFRVRFARASMKAFADEISVPVRDHRPHHRVGAGPVIGLRRQLQCAVDAALVQRGVAYALVLICWKQSWQ